LAERHEETRLDRLWQAVEDGCAEADWLRFYEGFAAQRLIVPMAEDGAAPQTLALASGEVALAFDTEARFAAFISGPTEQVTVTGADLARALAPLGLGVALNPAVAPGETVLDPEAVAWIAEHSGAEVAVEETSDTRLVPPAALEALLLEALGTRLAEMEAHVAEAWLVGTAEADGFEGYLCVLRTSGEAAGLGPEIGAELTRIGQIRAARPFSVAVMGEETALLAAARRLGIGLVG
jgi:hypothetical protein